MKRSIISCLSLFVVAITCLLLTASNWISALAQTNRLDSRRNNFHVYQKDNSPTHAQSQQNTPESFISGTVLRNSNLRTGPGTTFKILKIVRAGTYLEIRATNKKRDWYQLNSGEWIAAFLVDAPQATALPVAGSVVFSMSKPITDSDKKSLTTPSPKSLNKLACQQPPDEMEIVVVNGEKVNARTYWMLNLAQKIYDGPGSILRVVQGSYEPGLKESFGTHDGGGAVDISIRNPANSEEILWDEAPKMVEAMRQAGFAAWYRPTGMFGPNSGAHIHAIAIGDPDLSPSARLQLDGPEGYFRGFDGVPPTYGGANPDPHGGPVICQWMLEMGYKALQ